MQANEFRQHLTTLLEQNPDKVLLRILLSRTDSVPVELTGRDILERGRSLARQYCQAPPGGVVLLLLPHSVELFLLHFGLLLEGRLPAILAWPTNRIDPEKYQRNLLHQVSNLPAAQILTLPQLASNLGPGIPYVVSACAVADSAHLEKTFAVPVSFPAAEKRPPMRTAPSDTPADALFLQFSGGTTGAQKCVVVTSQMMVEQLGRLRDTLAFTAEDGVASWLPMYHDMGLIACLWFPLWYSAPSFQFSASDWLLDPELLFRTLDKYRATFCWLPNFAFSYLAGQRERMKNNNDLRHVRGFVNCSEPVRLRSMKAFAETFAPWGVVESQLQASYAMAENVFAVTQTPLGEVPATVPRSQVRQRSAAFQEIAYDMLDDVYVSSGRTLEGMQVRIRANDGEFAVDLQPGGIEIKAGCLFDGYWGNEGFQRHALSADGWYATGDYGFQNGKELFVIGRTKDIVIVGGQNVFPEDVEAIANTLEGIYPGRVVAFGVEDEQQGTESLTIVAEMRGEYNPAQAHTMERSLKGLVLSAIGIAPRYVKVVPERWIVKSTAGKISRRETRNRFVEDLRGQRAARS